MQQIEICTYKSSENEAGALDLILDTLIAQHFSLESGFGWGLGRNRWKDFPFAKMGKNAIQMPAACGKIAPMGSRSSNEGKDVNTDIWSYDGIVITQSARNAIY